MTATQRQLRLYLINPCNALVSIVNTKARRWNKFRVWKPLGLMVLAGMTPGEWEISILDENLGPIDFAALPKPDLVGLTAFTSQANRAYEIAGLFRAQGVPVVMGGIHATVSPDEAMTYVDAIITGEGEGVWHKVLEDAKRGSLQPRYAGGQADMTTMPAARQDLLPKGGYFFGSIQTTRGCPLNCSFCSVTAVNGVAYRQRPVADVVREFQTIKEKLVLIVDDNLIGTRSEHIARAKELFRAMAAAKIDKHWICQVTINIADDDELMDLAVKAGCKGVFIGFESSAPEGLTEVGKTFNLLKGRDLRASVKRIQDHKLIVVGSFIIGLEVDELGVGERIAAMARHYGVDLINVLFLTPLPGTRLWDAMVSAGQLGSDAFPGDWKYYTLTLPVAKYKNFTLEQIAHEVLSCNKRFYSLARIFPRMLGNFWYRRSPFIALFANLSFRGAIPSERKDYAAYIKTRERALPPAPISDVVA